MTEKVVYQLKSCPDHDKFAADIAYLRGAVTVGFTGKGVFPLAPGASITPTYTTLTWQPYGC